MDQLIKDTDWDNLLQGDTESCWNSFKAVLTDAQRQCVPLKKRRSPRKPLWMNSGCLRVVRKKRRLWRTYSQTQDYEDFLAYKKVEERVRKAVRNAKRNKKKILLKM